MTKEIRIYVANLRAYNEGELKGEWFTLPENTQTIFEAIFDDHERDENGNPRGDWAIHDYEAPFHINEYDSIDELNSIAAMLNDLNIPDSIFTSSPDVYDVINFAMELCNTDIVPNADEYTQDIITDEGLDEMVAHIAQESGWQRVKYFLSGIDYMNDDFYIIDGYGNARNADSRYLENIVEELFTEMKNNN